MPNGPIIPTPSLPWQSSPSVLDSPLTKALRAITDLMGGDDLAGQVMGLIGTVDVPGGSGTLQKALGGLVERAKKGIRAFHGSPHDFARRCTVTLNPLAWRVDAERDRQFQAEQAERQRQAEAEQPEAGA